MVTRNAPPPFRQTEVPSVSLNADRMTLSRRVMDAVLVQETSPSGRARQRFEAASQHEEGEDGARKAWEAELMQALKDEREVRPCHT